MSYPAPRDRTEELSARIASLEAEVCRLGGVIGVCQAGLVRLADRFDALHRDLTSLRLDVSSLLGWRESDPEVLASRRVCAKCGTGHSINEPCGFAEAKT